MKISIHSRKSFAIVGALLFSGNFLSAETDDARELKRVQEERDKAIAEASAPINRRYENSLEMLLHHATAAGDLDTAMKVKAALESLPQTVERQLLGIWKLRASTGYSADVTFKADGTGTHSGYGKFQWRIEGTTLYVGAGPNADKFTLPIKDGSLSGVNSIGNQLILSKK